MKGNQQIMQKADLQVSDLMNDGGYLNSEQLKQFMRMVIEESRLISRMDVRTMKSHTLNISKIDMDTHVLKPGNSGLALPEADRVGIDTSEVEIVAKLLKAEIHLNDETLEDNVEGNNLKETVLSMFAEHIAADIEHVVINGDTTSTDDLLSRFNGMRKLATSNVVSAGGNPLAKTYLLNAMKTLPNKFNKDRSRYGFYTSEKAEMDYRDNVADRMTIVGDRYLTENPPVVYNGRPIEGVPLWPDDLGVSSNQTDALYCNLKNATVGFWRKVRVETDRDIRAGRWFAVATVRCGFNWREETAVVKISNINNS